jgi:D-lactate dehydrogenase
MFNKFVLSIKEFLNRNQIIEDELLRYAYSTDASLYRMVPKLVLIIRSESEAINVIKAADQYDIKLTFRAAGTSLSGQAVTDQVLVMLANDSWQRYSISDTGREITLEPGIIGADANKYLKAYKKQIGPDPGSINAAKIGGIIANNSSGMCCGTAKNSYATLKNMRAVLSDGSIFDSSDESLIEKFKIDHQPLLAEIESIREKILNDDEVSAFIRKKFSIKNTSGYSLNAFLDFEDPVKILERLMIGSEGTLGFVSNVTLNTIENYTYKALNLIYGRLEDLVKLTVAISSLELSSVELLDYFSLQSVAGDPEIQKFLIELPDENYALIMVAVDAENQAHLEQKITLINQFINNSKVYHQLGFSSNQETMATLWKARGGVLPTIAGKRPLGSTVIIEDVAVSIELLPELIHEMRSLFERYDFKNAAIFGHVLSGNIHFVITPNFNNENELRGYDAFMHEFTGLVANKFNGSLKAEHGSGRNISSFAIVEWGQKCWDLMWEIKHLLDPKGIFNPDVKLTRDNTLHMQHLKSFAAIHDEINACMECGFCEPVCPSRKLSLTPRQRNSVARKIATLSGAEKSVWQEKYTYYGIDTCATTGMCKTMCPVGINTGAFILEQKPENNHSVNHNQEIRMAKAQVKLGNIAASVIGSGNLQKITSFAHSKIKSIPIYLDTMPKAQPHKFNTTDNSKADILLVPACPNRVFASTVKLPEYPSKLILEKLGFSVKYLANSEDSCCGQMYHSKCNHVEQEKMITNLQTSLSEAQSIAIIDNSSCSGFAKDAGINLIDINKFLVENLDRNQICKKYDKIALHIDCSSAKHSYNTGYLEILQLCSKEVVIPEGIKCCGFAGDKGFKVPELNASSLSHLSQQVTDCELGVTFNRSCQIGLSHHGKIEYISFVELLLNCLE